jgi:starch-binding outer membrane protein, SusD/RagB family
MKKIFRFYLFASISLLLFSSCKKTLLNQPDPNNPSPAGSLKTEAGAISYAAGIMQRAIFNVPNTGNSNILAVAMAQQSIMGDETFVAYGNYGFRWTDQVYKVTLPGGTVVPNPFGVTQKVSLQGFNSRQAADRNAFMYEWTICYLFINQANIILANVDQTPFTGDAATKKAAIKAWALWWKGLSYSRIGSLYLAGLIYNGIEVPNNFLHHDEIIAEANRNFDLCATELNSLPAGGNADYDALMRQVVLEFNDNQNVVSPAMWKRGINTYKARNLLVNKKSADMTGADWQAVITLATDGLKSSDNYFKFGMAPGGINDLTNGFLHAFALSGPAVQWTFMSERFVQEFKSGDQRKVKGVMELPYPPDVEPIYQISAFANLRSRGLQFGTRWAAIPIESGGLWATADHRGTVPLGGSYEENALMLAEAYINTAQIEKGLGYVDEVRSYQNAGLPNVVGSGLALGQAKEELRKERRIALVSRGVAFFDARRWGVTAPVENGGGRTGAIVYVPKSVAGTARDEALPCFMEYNYMDYWDVPQNELDFNVPAAGSAPVKNQ